MFQHKVVAFRPVRVLAFDHLHFVHSPGIVKPLSAYKSFADGIRPLQSAVFTNTVDRARLEQPPKEFQMFGRDLPRQLIAAFGMQPAAAHEGPTTQTIALRSNHPKTGAVFVVSSPHTEQGEFEGTDKTHPYHDAQQYHKFLAEHNGRQGVFAMSFVTDDEGLDAILHNYKVFSPELLITDKPVEVVSEHGSFKMVEVWAYHQKDGTTADEGTRLRFIVRQGDMKDEILPGLKQTKELTFPEGAQPMTSDHWVSNVWQKEPVLDNWAQTLGLERKVEFDAGQVQGGKAAIVSTVIGNIVEAYQDALTADQSQTQVYLPVNSPETEVGHVPWHLQQLGQGFQHGATRIADVVSFIGHANQMRDLTGEGFGFLKIPKTYYGTLEATKLSVDQAAQGPVMAALKKAGLVNELNVVDVDITETAIREALDEHYEGPELQGGQIDKLIPEVLLARYENLYKLIGNHLSPEDYVQVIKNNILVDIHDGDVLLQIFTDRIMMHPPEGKPGLTSTPSDEAPFLEFVSRKCQSRESGTIKPGCGGFGIRNFITLFLSIEINKALMSLTKLEAKMAQLDGQEETVPYKTLAQEIKFQKDVIGLYRQQMEESQPILTGISDAATALAQAKESSKDVPAKTKAFSEAQGKLKESTHKFQQAMVALETVHAEELALISA